ncbi:hypothetical protein LshimejAT787_0307550 [Lyophyllum shimeji]|uniref:BZIP domain-containing protein n=1 Tax=Lyophyllum shimeji TaxID=47721 RepID=A0A9P3PJH0_LYOSH|nr:hypothetical protein LshimejAT787_0307550 [Lyophyllum shimeji]
MLLLKNQESKASLLSPTSFEDREDLALWEQLQFAFDMDNEPPGAPHNNPHSRDIRRTRSTSVQATQQGSTQSVTQSDAHDAELLAQFAAAAGLSSHGLSHPNLYGSLMPHGDYAHSGPSAYHDRIYNHGTLGHTQSPPLSSLDFPWHLFPPQAQTHQDQFPDLQRTLSHPELSSYLYTPPSLSPPMSSAPQSPTTGRPSRQASVAPAVASSSTSAGSPGPDQTEAERLAIAEEKRRRNTAASARFRIKKKQRKVNLERSVSDLTGRAEDLEREVADLRRENGWLKEIVLLKGSRLAGVNLASHVLAQNAQRPAENSSQTASSNTASGSKTAVSDSDDSSDEEASGSKAKKGKSRKK